MKRKIREIAGILAFFLLFGCLFYVTDATLQFKYDDGIQPMTDFYNYPKNSIDVLFLGSSHIGVNVDTTQLCNAFGISAFKLWGTAQPVWNAYYNLVEALKTQQPKVVVFETLSMCHNIEYQDYGASVKNTMGMHWSKNRIDAINASVAPEYRMEVLAGFAAYHSRYNELTEKDFQSYFWNYTFGEKNVHDWYAVFDAPLPSQTQERLPFGEKHDRYFKKLLSLCQREGIPLVCVSAPYSMPDEELSRLNTFRDYAKANDIPYMDFQANYQEIGIDFSTDYGDSAGHLNSYGVQKLTHAIGAYLKEHYDLPEHYNDPFFAYEIPSDATYVLQTPFQGDGQRKFLDTRVKLYDDPDYSWTLLTQFDTHCDSTEKIILSCFQESPPYQGLLVRLNIDGGLDIIVGDNYYTKLELPQKDRVCLAITKKGSQYAFYLDEMQEPVRVSSPCGDYVGSLTVGCQWLPDNSIGKLSAVNVHALEIYDGTTKDISDWMKKHTQILTPEEKIARYEQGYTSDFDYQLEKPFRGNGQDAYIDTGRQLYLEPEASWTLTAQITPPADNSDGVYFACFSEDPDNYRGLLVRKIGDMIQVILGQNQVLQSRLLSTAPINLTIQKNGYTYTVYQNGELLGSLESPCDSYVGPLLVGAELDNDYTPYRFSALTVGALEVKNS